MNKPRKDNALEIKHKCAQALCNPFRTNAWVQAWLDTWGGDSRIELIDLGGAKKPLEILYRTKCKLKKILPVNTLALAGIGVASFHTPRSEYNNIDSIIAAAGGLTELAHVLGRIKWAQFSVSDIDEGGYSEQQLKSFKTEKGWRVSLVKSEQAYSISAVSVEQYRASLGVNTRAAYFNRRARLAEHGEIELCDMDTFNAHHFFEILNQFHILRWGVPCYSNLSLAFLYNFIERLQGQGGRVILQLLKVSGQTVSALFDIEFAGVRYNLQSGYLENRFHKIALGSIHFGYAIEAAIADGLIYDFMAGMGKYSNYKERVANRKMMLNSYMITRGPLKTLYKLYGK